jgi:hypothetical protein
LAHPLTILYIKEEVSMYSIGEFAEKIGVTIQTLRDRKKKDKSEPA